MNTLSTCCASIAQTCNDYQHCDMTTSHVEEWIMQFYPEYQLPIITEMDHILKNSYVSQKDITSFLNKILDDSRLFGENIKEGLKGTKFLNIQTKGHSQKELLEIVENILKEKYSLTLEACGNNSPNQYFYLDDAVYSGNTLKNDLTRHAHYLSENTNLHVVHIAHYSFGYWYVERNIPKELHRKKINVKFWRFHNYNNFINSPKSYDCLWPKEISTDENVCNYVHKIESECVDKNFTPRLYRNFDLTKENILKSSTNRGIVENEFLEKGAFIISQCSSPNETMRPLGYEYLKSLGFGALFVTYRNIANNAPLVLWWGDKTKPKSHPFSKWHPLFPRRINETNDFYDLFS